MATAVVGGRLESELVRDGSDRTKGLSRRTVLGTIAWSSLLSACTSPMTSSGETPAANALATPAAGQTLGSGSVRIALIVPASANGNAGAIATGLKNAADLALREFKGADLQILVKDDRGTPEGARAAAGEAIQEGARLILGPLFAPSVSAAAGVARPAGVPVIAFSTDTSVAERGVYLLSFLPQSDVERIVSFAGMRGRHAIAALLPANGYGTVVEAALQKYASANNSRVITIQRYQLDRVSMQVQAEAILPVLQRKEADTLLLPDAGDAAPFLAQYLASKNIRQGDIQILGSGQWDDPRILAEPALRGAWYPGPDRAAYSAFAARYQAAFGAPPVRTASLGYDGVSLAAGLAARYGQQAFTAQTIANPNGFLGVDGAFRFLPDGINQRGLAVYEVGAGTVTQIDPAPRTFSRTM